MRLQSCYVQIPRITSGAPPGGQSALRGSDVFHSLVSDAASSKLSTSASSFDHEIRLASRDHCSQLSAVINHEVIRLIRGFGPPAALLPMKRTETCRELIGGVHHRLRLPRAVEGWNGGLDSTRRHSD